MSHNLSHAAFSNGGWGTQDLSVTVQPGSTYLLPVTFQPPMEDTFTGKLVFIAGNKKVEVSLTGAGRKENLRASIMRLCCWANVIRWSCGG